MACSRSSCPTRPCGSAVDGSSTILEFSKRANGRKIQLQSWKDGNTYAAVVTRDVYDALQALADDVRTDPMELVLDYDGPAVTYLVHFDNDGVQGDELIFIVPTAPADFYFVTLNFIQVGVVD